MRLPASRGARSRTMVSTSGSSGMLGDIDQNLVAGDLNREGSHPHGRIVIVCASAAVELPGVPRAGEIRSVDRALPEGPAVMRARPGERTDAAIDVAERIQAVAN